MTSPIDLLNGDEETAKLAEMVRRGRTYVVLHRTCGHVVANPVSRPAAAAEVDQAPPAIRRQLRIRVAGAEDLVSWMRGERCAICTTDGRITGSAAR